MHDVISYEVAGVGIYLIQLIIEYTGFCYDVTEAEPYNNKQDKNISNRRK